MTHALPLLRLKPLATTALAFATLFAANAWAQEKTLRIAMTAADIPAHAGPARPGF